MFPLSFQGGGLSIVRVFEGSQKSVTNAIIA